MWIMLSIVVVLVITAAMGNDTKTEVSKTLVERNFKLHMDYALYKAMPSVMIATEEFVVLHGYFDGLDEYNTEYCRASKLTILTPAHKSQLFVYNDVAGSDTTHVWASSNKHSR